MDKNHITTLPKRGLKTRSYNMDMNKEDHITTLPKRDLKTRPYNIDMNERDLEILSKSELIKLLLKQKKSKKVRNHEACSTMTHLRMKLHKSLQNALNHQSPKLKRKST